MSVKASKSMQRSRTEAIRTQIQPSKPKREITKITNSQNTKRTYNQPSEQLFPKRWPLNNPNRSKHYMNTRKVKRHRYSEIKNRQQSTTTILPPWNGLATLYHKITFILMFFLRNVILDRHPCYVCCFKQK